MKILLSLIVGYVSLNGVMIRDSSVLDEDTVYDTTTKLIWQDDNDARERAKTWADAVTYCDGLTKRGYTWRLPSINELATIVDDTKSSPAHSDVFIQYSNARYWSSTTSAQYSDYAWQIDFTTGNEDYTTKSTTMNVRCVSSN